MWFSGLVRSFQNALRGVRRGLRAERNLRVHLTAVVYVTWAGLLAKLDGPSWGAVLLCFGGVFSAELFNTALEHLCDAVCPEQHEKIGAAKDAAAGAVLARALVSVGVAAAVFGPWLLAGGPMERPWALACVALSIPFAILWIRGREN